MQEVPADKEVANVTVEPNVSNLASLQGPTVPKVSTHEVGVLQQQEVPPERVVLVQHNEIPVSQNIHLDLDLWARIREYDQRMAAEGFTQMLSKKQQKDLKKQVLGKATYNTRTRGTPLPSSS
jgi:hypothetical protein